MPECCTAKNDEISPHFLLGKFWRNGHISPNFPKREMEISVSLQLTIETRPFPLNLHPRTMGNFWYFLLCARCYPRCSIVVHSVDTDVYVLLLEIYDSLCTSKLHMIVGKGKRQRTIDIGRGNRS